MIYSICGFCFISQGSPILLPVFKRQDGSDNKTYQMVQNRDGSIEKFLEFDSIDLQPVFPYRYHPLDHDLEIYKTGMPGFLALALNNGEDVHIIPWDEVKSFWEEHSRPYQDTFTDYYMKRAFNEHTNVVGIFPKKAANYNAWRVTEYAHSRRTELIWSRVSRTIKKNLDPLPNPQEIIDTFEDFAEILLWLDEHTGEQHRTSDHYKWRVAFRFAWLNASEPEEEIIANIALRQLKILPIDHSLHCLVFSTIRKSLDRPEFAELIPHIFEQLEGSRVRHSSGSTFDLEAHKNAFNKIERKLDICAKYFETFTAVKIDGPIEGEDFLQALILLFQPDEFFFFKETDSATADGAIKSFEISELKLSDSLEAAVVVLANLCSRVSEIIRESRSFPVLLERSIYYASKILREFADTNNALELKQDAFGVLKMLDTVRASLEPSVLDALPANHYCRKLLNHNISELVQLLKSEEFHHSETNSL